MKLYILILWVVTGIVYLVTRYAHSKGNPRTQDSTWDNLQPLLIILFLMCLGGSVGLTIGYILQHQYESRR